MNSTAAGMVIQTISSMTYGRFLPTICAFGIVGNILNLITLRGSALRAVSYMYLRALASADLMCMIFVLSFVMRNNGVLPSGNYFISWVAAHLELPLINTSITAGILIVIALTIERYVSVVFPTHFREWNTRTRAIQMITVAYVLSFALYIPMCWEKGVYPQSVIGNNLTLTDFFYAAKDNRRVKHSQLYVGYKWTREILVKVLPVISLTYLNVHIIVALKQVQRRKAEMVLKLSPKVGGQPRDDRRLLVLMTVIAVLFFVCNTPAALNLLIINDDLGTNVAYQIFRAIANLLEISNHAVNFYIFCTCSKDYREEFTRLFCRWRGKKSVLPSGKRLEQSTIQSEETKHLLEVKLANDRTNSSNGTFTTLALPENSHISQEKSDTYADEIFV